MPAPTAPDRSLRPDSAGVPVLLIVLSLLTAAGMAIICTFLIVGGWWMMGVALCGVFIGALLLVLAITKTLGQTDFEPYGTAELPEPQTVELPMVAETAEAAPVAAESPEAERDEHVTRRRSRYAPAGPASRV